MSLVNTPQLLIPEFEKDEGAKTLTVGVDVRRVPNGSQAENARHADTRQQISTCESHLVRRHLGLPV